MDWLPLGALVLMTFILLKKIFFGYHTDYVRRKRAIITGGSQGVGEHLAYHLARLGADIFIVARNEASLRRVIDNCKNYGPKGARHYYMAADLGDLSATKRVIKRAEETLGGIDLLFLNHAVLAPMEPWRHNECLFSRLRKVMDFNFTSYVHMTSFALPALEKSKGRIAIIGSIVGKVAVPFMLAYSSSKFAIDGFFSGLRQELKLYGKDVSVTQAVLGVMATRKVKEVMSERLGVIHDLDLMEKPEDAASQIIQGTIMRQREVHYPHWQGVFIIQLLRDWCPDLIDFAVRQFYK